MSMNFPIVPLVFYGFALVALVSAIMVISVQNTVMSVLALVMTFFATAGLWMLLHAEFLSLILVLVYVGAVMTLFLFVVMMLNVTAESRRRLFGKWFPVGVFSVVLFVITMLALLYLKNKHYAAVDEGWLSALDQYSNTKALGMLLFSHYLFEFELAGMLLLAAMIAAIALAYRGVKERKAQNIEDQIHAKPSDRIKLISMKPARPSSQRGKSS